jgi:hypothetical protein
MLRNEPLALREGNRMRMGLAHVGELRPRPGDQVVADPQIHFAADRQLLFRQQLVVAHDRSGETVLDRQQRACDAIARHGGEDVLERTAGNGLDRGAEELACRFFGEGAALALESDGEVHPVILYQSR